MSKKNFFLILLILLCNTIMVTANPISCESLNASIIKCYNQGSIENTTYYRTDGLQMANALDRFGWATYEMGLLWWVNEVPIMMGVQDLEDLTFTMSTDNTTYYYLAWSGELRAGGKRGILTYSVNQKLYDDYVNITTTFEATTGWQNWNREMYLYRKMTDINIDNDGDVDAVNYHNGSTQGWYINETTPDWFNLQEQWLSIGDIDGSPDSAIRWWWTDTTADGGFYLPSGAGNGEVGFYKRIGIINNGGLYADTVHWIDVDVCTKACGKNIAYFDTQLVCSADGSVYKCDGDSNRNVDVFFKVLFSSLFGTGTCSYGTGCHVHGTSNSTEEFPTDPLYWNESEIPYRTNATEPTVVCDSMTAMTCGQDTITSQPFSSHSYSRRFNITCRNASTMYYAHCYFPFESDFCQYYLQIKCPADTGSPNVTLVSPISGYSTTETSINFTCNGTDDYPLTTGYLWGNFTDGEWKINGTDTTMYPEPSAESTFELHNLSVGVYVWNCEYCDNNYYCAMAASNFTLLINETTTPITPTEVESSIIPLFTNISKKKGFLGLLSVCCLGLFMLPLWLRRRKNRNKDGVGDVLDQ